MSECELWEKKDENEKSLSDGACYLDMGTFIDPINKWHLNQHKSGFRRG